MAGYATYLSHLDFDQEIHIVDNTVVPISGTVYIWSWDGNEGFQSTNCPLEGAKVCLVLKSSGDQAINQELDCADTDATGLYRFYAVVGTQWVYTNWLSLTGLVKESASLTYLLACAPKVFILRSPWQGTSLGHQTVSTESCTGVVECQLVSKQLGWEH